MRFEIIIIIKIYNIKYMVKRKPFVDFYIYIYIYQYYFNTDVFTISLLALIITNGDIREKSYDKMN